MRPGSRRCALRLALGIGEDDVVQFAAQPKNENDNNGTTDA